MPTRHAGHTPPLCSMPVEYRPRKSRVRFRSPSCRSVGDGGVPERCALNHTGLVTQDNDRPAPVDRHYTMLSHPVTILVAARRAVSVKSRMRYIMYLCLLVLSTSATSGCGTPSSTKLTGAVRYVNIRVDIAPRQLIAQIGDEIRWQNLNPEPVRLRLLEEGTPALLECGQGFSRFGVVQDTVTIAPQQYASLCFAKPGTIRFNVWLDADNPQGTMTPTGSIRIEPRTGLKRNS